MATAPPPKELLSDEGSFECKVSSVLNRKVKEFGKRHLFDGRDDTCWNSEQGSPQWVRLAFPRAVRVAAVRVMFQGGFAGRHCWLEASADGGRTYRRSLEFFPEDGNGAQTFPLPEEESGDAFRLVFGESSDLFGRVTVYHLQLLGHD